MVKELSNTARAILTEAATRPDRRLLPLPKTLKAPQVIVEKSIGALIGSGLVAEISPGAGEPVWQGANGRAVALVARAEGLAAIGLDPVPASPAHEPAKAARRRSKAKSPGAGGPEFGQAARPATSRPSGPTGRQSKQDACIALLRRGNGATISEMISATGWRSHSVRGFMSGALKKRLGLAIVSQKTEGGERRYHIAALRSEPEQS